MGEEKITYRDVEEYEKLFSLVPPFLLERFAKKNKNLVLKFESNVRSFLEDLSANQRNKLDIILNTPVNELQCIMDEAYQKTNKKQYKILANPKYGKFIETNLEELCKILKK